MGFKAGIAATLFGIVGFYSTLKDHRDNLEFLSSISTVDRYYEVKEKLDSLELSGLSSNEFSIYNQLQQERANLASQENFDSLRAVYDRVEKNQFNGGLFLASLIAFCTGPPYLEYLRQKRRNEKKRKSK